MAERDAGTSRGDTFATASLVLGLSSGCCSCVTGVPAIALGVMALSSASPEKAIRAKIGIGLGVVLSTFTLFSAILSDDDQTPDDGTNASDEVAEVEPEGDGPDTPTGGVAGEGEAAADGLNQPDASVWVVRVSVMGRAVAPEHELKPWDVGDEEDGPAPDLSGHVSLGSQRIRVDQADSFTFEGRTDAPVAGGFTVDVDLKDKDGGGIFSSGDKIGKERGLSCPTDTDPCTLRAGAALVQVLTPEQAEASSLDDFSKAAPALWVKSWLADSAWVSEAEVPLESLPAALGSVAEAIEQACTNAEAGDDCASAFDELSRGLDPAAWAHLDEALEVSDLLARARKAARPALVERLGEVVKFGGSVALRDSTVRVTKSETVTSYRNPRQNGYFEKAKLESEGKFLIVHLSTKNTSNELISLPKAGTGLSEGDFDVVSPFGHVVGTDGDLESYMAHAARGTRDFEVLYYDVKTGETWSSKLGFDVPADLQKSDLFLRIQGDSADGEKKTWLVPLR